MSKIVDLAQERCRDTRLVEEILGIADACEAEYMRGPTGIDQKRGPILGFATPKSSGKKSATGPNDSSGLMSSIRNLWS